MVRHIVMMVHDGEGTTVTLRRRRRRHPRALPLSRSHLGDFSLVVRDSGREGKRTRGSIRSSAPASPGADFAPASRLPPGVQGVPREAREVCPISFPKKPPDFRRLDSSRLNLETVFLHSSRQDFVEDESNSCQEHLCH